jgi:hypothetical protein
LVAERGPFEGQEEVGFAAVIDPAVADHILEAFDEHIRNSPDLLPRAARTPHPPFSEHEQRIGRGAVQRAGVAQHNIAFDGIRTSPMQRALQGFKQRRAGQFRHVAGRFLYECNKNIDESQHFPDEVAVDVVLVSG